MKKKNKKAVKPQPKASKKMAKRPAPSRVEKSAVGVIPMSDRVLVKALSPEEAGTMTSFGIIIPDSAKEKPEQGMVVAVGPGKRADNGSLIAPSVKVGDKIMFSKYGFDEIKVQGVEYLILPESSILAVIE